jgi:hypothetical protein
MDKELENSLNKATIAFGVISLITSIFVVYSSLYFEETNFHNNLSRVISTDFAQIETLPLDQNKKIINLVDKYDVISGERFDIHSTEVFNGKDSGRFIYASAGDRVFRFEIKPEKTYFYNRIKNLAFLSLMISIILIFLIRIIFKKIVFNNILNSNKLLNSINTSAYSKEITQTELINKTFELQKTERANYQLRMIHRLLRRFSRLPSSSTR